MDFPSGLSGPAVLSVLPEGIFFNRSAVYSADGRRTKRLENRPSTRNTIAIVLSIAGITMLPSIFVMSGAKTTVDRPNAEVAIPVARPRRVGSHFCRQETLLP